MDIEAEVASARARSRMSARGEVVEVVTRGGLRRTWLRRWNLRPRRRSRLPPAAKAGTTSAPLTTGQRQPEIRVIGGVYLAAERNVIISRMSISACHDTAATVN